MNDKTKEKRILWIDVVKAFAILAVLTDHTRDILYSNTNISWFTGFSVQLFIIVIGINTYMTYERNHYKLNESVKHKLLGIIKPYVLATFLFYIFINKGFVLYYYCINLINFNISGPLYYVALYIQLILVSPIIFNLLYFTDNKKYKHLVELLLLILVFCISLLTSNRTVILDIAYSGGRLFGGTQFFLFYLGMLLGKYYNKIHFNKITLYFGSVIFLSLVLFWWRFMIKYNCILDDYLHTNLGGNPPNLTLIIYGILMFSALYFIVNSLSTLNIKVINNILNVISRLGKHTLYIFLYHRFFIDIVIENIKVKYNLEMSYSFQKTLLYFMVMIVGSLLIELSVKEISKRYKKLTTQDSTA